MLNGSISIWDTESVWCSYRPCNKCRPQWPIFHGPVTLLYIFKNVPWMNVILWDSESVWFNDWPYNKRRLQWPIFHGPVILIYYACHWSHDLTLYFHSETLQFYWQSAIQAPALIKTLVRYQSSLRCWHLGHGLKIKEWPILHDPVILPNMLKTLMDEWHTWDNHKDWSHKVYIGQWFHGPVIFKLS